MSYSLRDYILDDTAVVARQMEIYRREGRSPTEEEMLEIIGDHFVPKYGYASTIVAMRYLAIIKAVRVHRALLERHGMLYDVEDRFWVDHRVLKRLLEAPLRNVRTLHGPDVVFDTGTVVAIVAEVRASNNERTNPPDHDQ